MKNELGIEVCCENCWHSSSNTWRANGNKCELYEEDGKNVVNTKRCRFWITNDVYESRIKELQEQKFTEEELQFIKRAVFEYSEMSDFDYKPILKKIDQTLKNLEKGLNYER